MKIILKIFKPLFKLTYQEKAPTDNQLDDMISQYLFLVGKMNALLFSIVRKKTARFFRYRWKTLIAFLIVCFGIYSLFKYTDIMKTKYIFVKETKVDMVMTKKTSVCFSEDSIFDPKLKTLFDFISNTESKTSGNYKALNESSDAWGRYQFTPIAREAIGLSCSRQFFLDNPLLQDVAMYLNLKMSDKYFELKGIYKKYVGKVYKGRYITKMGILALAHAEGAGFVEDYLYSLEKGIILPTKNTDAEMRLTFNPDWELDFK